MSDALAMLRGTPGAVRVRRLGPAAPGALHTGYDIWDSIDFYRSELRDRYLAGEVKGVMAAVPLKFGRAFETFNIVPVAPAERPAVAARHRQRLLLELRAQYKNRVVEAVALATGRNVKRLRYAINKALGGSAPAIEAVDRHFAAHPAALAHAAPIKALAAELAA